MTAVDVFNAIEVVVWGGIGLEFLRRGFITRSISPRLAIIAGVAFILFGLSDVVELQTGAFWRPWWLLVWKGVCIAVFFGLWWTRRRNAASVASELESSSAETSTVGDRN